MERRTVGHGHRPARGQGAIARLDQGWCRFEDPCRPRFPFGNHLVLGTVEPDSNLLVRDVSKNQGGPSSSRKRFDDLDPFPKPIDESPQSGAGVLLDKRASGQRSEAMTTVRSENVVERAVDDGDQQGVDPTEKTGFTTAPFLSGHQI